MPGKKITHEIVEPNREQVRKLAMLGCTREDIAFIVGISPSSLDKHFTEELAIGRAHLRSSLRKAQIDLALREKNPTMLIWLGKNYLGQKEPRHEVEHSGGVTVEKVQYSVIDIEDAVKDGEEENTDS